MHTQDDPSQATRQAGAAAQSGRATARTALRDDVEVIGLVGLAHGTSHFFHFLLPPLFPWLMRDFGLSFTQAGFLMTVFFVISGIGQALAGFVVDRLGARVVLLFGVATLGVSGAVLGAATSYAGLVAAAAGAGLGNSIFHPADFTLLNRRVSAHRLGHAFSVHGLAASLGWAAAPVFLVAVAAASDWRTAAFSACGVAVIVVGVLLLRLRSLDDRAVRGVVAEAAPPSSSERAAAADVGQFAFLRSGAVWMCFVFFFFITAAFGILQSFAPPLLQAVYGLPFALATTGLTAYLVASAVGTIVGGFLVARGEQGDRVIAWALGLAAATSLLLASGSVPGWSAIVLMALMGFGAGAAGPSRDMLVRKAATARFGRASFGRVYGFVYSGLDIGLAITPVLFGPLLDAGQFQLALIGVAVLQTGGLLSAIRVGRGARNAAGAALARPGAAPLS
jgi:MFS family permease